MKSKIALLITFAIYLLTGCASGRQIDNNNISQIQKNVTTEAQLTEMFGEPTQVITTSDSNVKQLIYLYATDNRVGRQVAGTTGSMAGAQIGAAAHPVLGIVGAIAGSAAGSGAVKPSGEQQRLVVSVDKNTGVVTEYAFTTTKTN